MVVCVVHAHALGRLLLLVIHPCNTPLQKAHHMITLNPNHSKNDVLRGAAATCCIARAASSIPASGDPCAGEQRPLLLGIRNRMQGMRKLFQKGVTQTVDRTCQEGTALGLPVRCDGYRRKGATWVEGRGGLPGARAGPPGAHGGGAGQAGQPAQVQAAQAAVAQQAPARRHRARLQLRSHQTNGRQHLHTRLACAGLPRSSLFAENSKNRQLRGRESTARRTGRPGEASMADGLRACQFSAAMMLAASACGSGRPPGHRGRNNLLNPLITPSCWELPAHQLLLCCERGTHAGLRQV